ncbi:prepilin-type N-terminal cleavage/methylation domain-containing protein [Acinetobacter gandensis]|uniref:Pilus assembly protein PilV n=1 Tax=Acinetobacter gandensis TaxID=1443941 RepID=A0A1A7RCF7_9GAMM|nr:prepilin-type N-terminal cleavage/methylation domain-containing protein [Acinetobacter gandensis]OBX29128.1 pilus assembly protein PilV [Acinetobacter gandensis]
MINNQKGVGLIEIIASLVILAVAVMGFIALQYRTLEAASESLNRVEAVNIARNLAERMYVSRASYKDCLKSSCSGTTFAGKDWSDVNALASQRGMNVGVFTCPDTQNGRQCIYVAWGETDANPGSCTETNKFSYKSDAKCVVVEAYQ